MQNEFFQVLKKDHEELKAIRRAGDAGLLRQRVRPVREPHPLRELCRQLLRGISRINTFG
jgi:hypothetical protein